MATGLFNWSRVANNNATATYNMAEGMAPSAVNDGIRGLMSDVAQYRDDIAGAIVTGGTSTAYTVTSYSTFTSLALMANQLIAFTPHTTNGATVTLNVDALGAKPLRPSPNVELQSNVLITGTPYMATFNNSDGVWYLHGNVGSAAFVPLGAGMDFWGSTAPSSAFAFPAGQAISRTTYATLFALLSTTYGSGNGSTTFNLPDKTGRVSAMKEASNSRLTPTYFGSDSTVLGAGGGSESHTLTTAELAAHSHGVTDSMHQHGTASSGFAGTSSVNVPGGAGNAAMVGATSLSAFSTTINASGIAINNAGSGNAHANVPPTIICNYILRVI